MQIQSDIIGVKYSSCIYLVYNCTHLVRTVLIILLFVYYIFSPKYM